MKVREIMDRRTRQISSSAMISEAADRMRSLGSSLLPVVEERRIIGIITERDIVARASSAGASLDATIVKTMMAASSVCCSEEADAEEAARLIDMGQASWLVVLNSDGDAVGILSAEDLAMKLRAYAHPRPLMEGDANESPHH